MNPVPFVRGSATWKCPKRASKSGLHWRGPDPIRSTLSAARPSRRRTRPTPHRRLPRSCSKSITFGRRLRASRRAARTRATSPRPRHTASTIARPNFCVGRRRFRPARGLDWSPLVANGLESGRLDCDVRGAIRGNFPSIVHVLVPRSSPVHPALFARERANHRPVLCRSCTPSSPKRLDSVRDRSSPVHPAQYRLFLAAAAISGEPKPKPDPKPRRGSVGTPAGWGRPRRSPRAPPLPRG